MFRIQQRPQRRLELAPSNNAYTPRSSTETGAASGEARTTPPMVVAATALRNAVSSALRAGEYELGETLLIQLRDLASFDWAPAAARAELARALGVVHIVAWREEDAERAKQALCELQAIAERSNAGGIEREQLARAWSREHGIADRCGDEDRAAEALATLQRNALAPDASELDWSLWARALYRGHRARLAQRRRDEAAHLLSELRSLSRRTSCTSDERLCFARALIDAIWFARNPGSPRSRALRIECLALLDGMPTQPTARALRTRLP